MKFDYLKIFSWTPKIIASIVLVIGLVALIIYGSGDYFVAGIMTWTSLLLTTLIAWKNEPIGGSIFIILGSGYLLFSMSKLFDLTYIFAAAPLFVIGSLFILDYVYLGRKEETIEGVDDF
jgi:hypothetical protein